MKPETAVSKTGAERAVSPIVGVILMTAITAVLAAMVAGAVAGVGLSEEATAGITFEQEPDPDPAIDDGYIVTVERIAQGNVDSIYVSVETEGPSDTSWVSPSEGDNGGNQTVEDREKRDPMLETPGDSLEIYTHHTQNNVPYYAGSWDDVDRVAVIGELDGEETLVATHDVE